MKKNKSISIFLLMAILIIASGGCKKGDTGPAGANGANGTNGKDGNANVILVMFGQQTFTNSIQRVTLTLPDSIITPHMIDSSLVLIYHENCSGLWYGTPGLGCSAAYNTRAYTYSTTSQVTLYLEIEDPDGSYYSGSGEIFTRVRVIVAPASVYKGSRLSADLSDYYTALRFFNLKDL